MAGDHKVSREFLVNNFHQIYKRAISVCRTLHSFNFVAIFLEYVYS